MIVSINVATLMHSGFLHIVEIICPDIKINVTTLFQPREINNLLQKKSQMSRHSLSLETSNFMS